MEPDQATSKTPSNPQESTVSSDQTTFSFRKKNIWVGLILLALFLLGVVLAKSGILRKFSPQAQKGNLALVISDRKTQKLLQGISVSVRDQTQTTNADGYVRFADLPTGRQIFQFSLTAYQGSSQELTIKKGENETVFVRLEPIPPITKNLRGQLSDLIDKKSISKAKITLNNKLAKNTDENGSFVFEALEPGQYDLEVTATNYLSFKQTINLAETDLDLGQIQLAPTGKALFVSNRDGNRAIYTANLDSSETKKFLENKEGTDDYSVYLADDKSLVVFFSNRDQEKDDYGNASGKLYFVKVGSTTVQKVSDDLNPSNIKIFPNSQSLVYTTSRYDKNSNRSLATLTKHDFASQKLTPLVDNYDFENKESGSGQPNLYLSEIAVSPDSNWIVFFASTYSVYSGQPPLKPAGIYIMYQDGSGLRPLIERTSVYNLKFSQDGGSLIYNAYTEKGTQKFSYNIQAGTEKALEQKDSSVLSAVAGPYETTPAEVESSDGARIAFRDFRDGKTDLFVKDKDGKEERRLTNLGGVNRIFWLRNRYLVFSVQRESESAAYIVGFTEKSQLLKITDIHDGSALAGVLP